MASPNAESPESKPPRRPRASTMRDLLRASPLKARLRDYARRWAGRILGWKVRLPARDDWVFFPYYHFVFDDERENFARQLETMRSLGDFISLDDAVAALRQPGGVQGRYFCLTFDDGFKNWRHNALPILVEHRCPATFFLTTDYIGLDLDADWDRMQLFYRQADTFRIPIEFLNWDECRAMLDAGMTLGSHTCTHRSLKALSLEDAERELRESKRVIEERTGRECRHFCAPYGVPGEHFDTDTHVALARKIGYCSFISTAYGYNRCGDGIPYLRRRCMNAGDDPSILRYALRQCLAYDRPNDRAAANV